MIKLVPILAISLLSLPAHAVQKDITVVADIDPTLEMLQPDGSALPSTVRMNYVPGMGLLQHEFETKIFTNNITKNLNIRLAHSPVLGVRSNPAATPIPLKVTYHGNELTTAATELEASDLFTGTGAVPGGSIDMKFTIDQKTRGAITAAGHYEGVVSVVVTQAS